MDLLQMMVLSLSSIIVQCIDTLWWYIIIIIAINLLSKAKVSFKQHINNALTHVFSIGFNSMFWYIQQYSSMQLSSNVQRVFQLIWFKGTVCYRTIVKYQQWQQQQQQQNKKYEKWWRKKCHRFRHWRIRIIFLHRFGALKLILAPYNQSIINTTVYN